MAVLRQRAFLWYSASRFTSGTSNMLLQAAISWHVWEISGSVFQLGLVGLMRFFPALFMNLIAGAVADSYDRRRITMFAQVVPLIVSAALVFAVRADADSLALIYAAVFCIAISSSFENPARQALLPSIVRPETFVRAITINSVVQSFAFVSGPTVAGLAIAATDVSGAYATNVVLLALSLASLAMIRVARQTSDRRAVSIAAIKEGVAFVWQRQVLLGAMTLDMFAVIFGGAKALLPVYATDILEVGPTGYGLLAASMEAGAFLVSILLVFLPPIERTGRTLLLSVAAFGLAVIVFGLSRSFPLSLVAYMSVGMADQVSVVMRSTTIQLATPDELRGRVTSVNMIFIGASNQLGAVESGFVAAITSATFAVVSGGIACVGVVAAVAAGMPELRNYCIGPRPTAAPVVAPPVESEEEDVASAAG